MMYLVKCRLWASASGVVVCVEVSYYVLDGILYFSDWSWLQETNAKIIKQDDCFLYTSVENLSLSKILSNLKPICLKYVYLSIRTS